VEIRVGQGFDIHPFEAGRALWLGGVRVPDHEGLRGHSDADVLCHALCDALLGAAALGDLGLHFPDSDERWAGAAGLDLVCAVRAKVEEEGWRAVNADLTLLGERPSIAPHAGRMRAALASALGVGEGAVSVKATTLEGLGALGRGEGLAALAVVLLRRDD